MTPAHALLALGVAGVWGINFVAIKIGLATLPPFLFAFLRFVAAAVPLAFFVRPPATAWRWLWAYALAQFTGQFALLFWGIRLGMPAGLSSAVIQSQAFFTFGLAAAFLGERPRAAHLFAAAVAGAGLAVVAWHVEGRATLVGFALVVAAGLSWACGNIVTRRIALGAAAAGDAVRPLPLVVWASVLATIPLAVLSLVFDGPDAVRTALARADARVVGAVLFNGWIVTLFGFGAWSCLMRRHPATTIAPFALLVPIVGIASSAVWLGEPIRPWMATATALVVAGLALQQYGTPRSGDRTDDDASLTSPAAASGGSRRDDRRSIRSRRARAP